MANSNQNNRNDDAPKKKKKKSRLLVFFQKLFAVIVTTLLSLFLVIVITGTIVSTALTIYVISFMEEATSITLTELESGSDTYFYGTEINEDGEEELIVLQRMKTDVQRVPISIDKISQSTRDAFTCTEDERFYQHDGVDYKRTFSAFLNLFLHFYNTEQGGSTITQQLIKNLTGASGDRSPQQKIREIFAAMQLEKTYSKDEILEEYLNFIGFGGPINGIQLASTKYFGKNVEDLTVPEAAVLAAIPKDPNYYYPWADNGTDEQGRELIDGKANNKMRQEDVLWQMYKNGAITYDEYQEYINTKIVFTDDAEYKKLHPEVDLEAMETELKAYSWEVDAMMWEAIGYIEELYNIDEEKALQRINKGGYRIYSTIDRQMQDYVEEKFLDINNLLDANWVKRWVDIDNDGETDEVLPHVAFTALRYDGSVMATVGQWGEKTHSLVTNYAVHDKRQIGSTIKPISTYGLALETDEIHWGSLYRNSPLPDVKDDAGNPWPFNYGRAAGDGAYHPIYYYLQQSFNTVPAQLCQNLTPESVYEFSTEKLGLDLYGDGVLNDKNLAPLALGGLTYGVTLQNLVNAYLPYGSGTTNEGYGTYHKAHIISKIEDANHNILVDNTNNGQPAVSEDTAWVMNRLLKNVVENGTGTTARLSYKVVAGKTGTTEDWCDSAFVGLTRDFASGVTVGYEQYRSDLSLPSNFHACSTWKNIIGTYADTMYTDTPADFDPVESVISMPTCSVTGMCAGEYCPKGVTGYWKSTNSPICNGSHYGAVVSTSGGSTSNNNDNSGNSWGGDTGGNSWGGDTGGNSWGGDTGGNSWGGETGGGSWGVDTGGDDSWGGDTGGDGSWGGDTGGDSGIDTW